MTWCVVERTKTEAEKWFSCVIHEFLEVTPLFSRPRYKNTYHKN